MLTIVWNFAYYNVQKGEKSLGDQGLTEKEESNKKDRCNLLLMQRTLFPRMND